MEINVQIQKKKKQKSQKKNKVKPEYQSTYFDDFIIFLAEWLKRKKEEQNAKTDN